MLKKDLEQRNEGDSTMTYQFLKLAAAGAILALSAANHVHLAHADEMVQNLGPVGPNETILATFGNKRAIAFYEADNGRCAVNAIVYEKTDAETGSTTAMRVRVSLDPRQMLYIDSTDNRTLNLQCGDYAKTLAAVGTFAAVDNDLEVAAK
jgi:hypothetical protein